jgi:hypothetical protein
MLLVVFVTCHQAALDRLTPVISHTYKSFERDVYSHSK